MLPASFSAKVCQRGVLVPLQVAADCSLLALPMQMMKIVCELIPILMQQHSCSECICGCLLLTVLLQGSCCVKQLLEGLLICRISQVGCPELSITLSMKHGGKMLGNILNVDFELIPPDGPAEC